VNLSTSLKKLTLPAIILTQQAGTISASAGLRPFPGRQAPKLHGIAPSSYAVANSVRLCQDDHRAVIAWERIMHEGEGAAASTVRRRLAALSSLFKHLVRYGYAEKNPVSEVERPAINRREGSTLAFSKADAAKLLDRPDEKTLEGLRDRAILAVGL
jgi:site-specific recombinase XerC